MKIRNLERNFRTKYTLKIEILLFLLYGTTFNEIYFKKHHKFKEIQDFKAQSHEKRKNFACFVNFNPDAQSD